MNSFFVMLVGSVFLTAVTGLHHASAADGSDEGFVSLFEGDSLQGWKCFVSRRPAPDDQTVFTIVDGGLRITGKPFGFLQSERNYRNFAIEYDWKFDRPADLVDDETFRGNGGLFLFIQELPEKRNFPICVEVQGAHKTHGRIFNISGLQGGKYRFDQEALNRVRRAVGEWNTTRVVVQSGDISVSVNGTPVAQGHCELVEGPIGFQSEGAPWELRRIRIKELP